MNMFKNETDATTTTPAPDRTSKRSVAILSTLILAVAAASICYRLLVVHHLEQTSALFIGLPTVLALLVARGVHPERPLGMVFKGMTLLLLVSGIFLGEGFVCILMAAPLFFAVGLVIAIIVKTVTAWKEKQRDTRLISCIAVLALGPMSLEGVLPELSFPRDEQVAVSQRVEVRPEAFADALEAAPRFDAHRLPWLFQLGFPRPAEVAGSGLRPGDSRTILFAGGEGQPGTLTLEVTASASGRTHFRAVSDSSHIAHWLSWQEAIVEWEPLWDDPETTVVTWTFRYRRELDPAWYFGPWERYAVAMAASHLIDTFAAAAEAR